MPVERIESIDACEALWHDHHALSRNLFHDWELRVALASAADASPFFLRHSECGTVLPLCRIAGTTHFFGGRYYNEYNGFLGPPGGETALLAELRRLGGPVRLLSWAQDPIRFAAKSQLNDVPFNQYWCVDSGAEFDEHLNAMSSSRRKRIRYIMRRFDCETEKVDRDLLDCPDFRDLLTATTKNLNSRGRTATYDNAEYLSSLRLVLEILRRREQLYCVRVSDAGDTVGVGLIAHDLAGRRNVFLTNLYHERPQEVSNAIVLNVLKVSLEHNCSVDGMRGAFGLKSKYGFRPVPAFALVRDPAWQVQSQSDLSEAELLTLYGRPFGNAPSRDRCHQG